MGGNAFTSFPAGVGGIGGWVELDRTILGSASSTIVVSSLPNKRYYKILLSGIPTGSTDPHWRFNSDSGSNYSYRHSVNGGADATNINADIAIGQGGGSRATPFFAVAYLSNLASEEKLHQNWFIEQETAGAGTAPSRAETISKWANTSVALNSFTATTASSTFATGSEVVVLGWDPADIHTTNFWEELASVDLSGGESDTISSGVFTPKKYLWIQFFLESSGTVQDGFRVGNTTVDTGSNYSYRSSANGGADATSTSQTDIGDFANINLNSFHNIFAINNSGNEKLFTMHNNLGVSSGAGTAPTRFEIAAKWANTSNQIDIVEMRNVAGGGNYGTKTIVKVWGAN